MSLWVVALLASFVTIGLASKAPVGAQRILAGAAIAVVLGYEFWHLRAL